MRPLTAVAMVLLVAGPWYTLVGMATEGEWLVGFFGVHNFGRFCRRDGRSQRTDLLLPDRDRGRLFPVVGLGQPDAPANAQALSPSNHPWRPGYVLACSWMAVWVGFFSLAGTKLPSYIVPAYPALALLTACFVASWIREPAALPRLLTRLAWGCVALVGIGLLVGLPIVAHYCSTTNGFWALLGLIPLVAAVVGWIASAAA